MFIKSIIKIKSQGLSCSENLQQIPAHQSNGRDLATRTEIHQLISRAEERYLQSSPGFCWLFKFVALRLMWALRDLPAAVAAVKGFFVLMAFGHNLCACVNALKRDRHTEAEPAYLGNGATEQLSNCEPGQPLGNG